MRESSSGRDKIKLRQWRRGRHSCVAVEIRERMNSAQGTLEVTPGGAGGSSDTQTAFLASEVAQDKATMFHCHQSARRIYLL